MALTFIRDEVLKLRGFNDLCDNQDGFPKWNAMLNLMKRQWFLRRRDVQGIALANDAMIYCGKGSIPWKDFADTVQLFIEVETATRRLSKVMKKDPKYYHALGWFKYVSALGASLFVEATGMLFPKSNSQEGQALLSLEYLVSKLTVFEVTDPKSLAAAWRSLRHVHARILTESIKWVDRTLILWLDFRVSVRATTAPQKLEKSSESRCGSKSAKIIASTYVSRLVVETVDTVNVASQSGNIPREWIDFGGWYCTDDHPPEDFWRTLVADRCWRG